jgi:hypothetical protein
MIPVVHSAIGKVSIYSAYFERSAAIVHSTCPLILIWEQTDLPKRAPSHIGFVKGKHMVLVTSIAAMLRLTHLNSRTMSSDNFATCVHFVFQVIVNATMRIADNSKDSRLILHINTF